MRRILLIVIVLVVNLLLISAGEAQASGNKCVVGYGYSNVLLDEERHELLLMGFKYGLDEGFKKLGAGKGPCSSRDKIEIIEVKKLKKGKLDALYAAQELLSKGASLLAGFSTSHEATLVASFAEKNNVAYIAPAAGTSRLKQYGDHVFSTSVPNSDTVKYRLEQMSDKYPSGDVLIIAKKDSAYSVNMMQELTRLNGQHRYGLKITNVYLNDEDQLDEQLLKRYRHGNVEAVFITTYPSVSKRLMEQLLRNMDSHVDYYVAGAWVSIEPEDMFDLLAQLKRPVRAVSIWPPVLCSDNSNGFSREFYKRFGKYPPVECAHGYDAGLAAAHVLFNSSGSDQHSVLQSLRSLKCFESDTVGKMCRRGDGFARRRLYNVIWSNEKFKIEH